MALIQSKYAKGIVTVPFPAFAGAVVGLRFAHTLSAAPAANDIIELAPILPGLVPLDMILDSDDLDTDGTPAITLDVGIMSGVWGVNDGARTVGAEFFSGSTVAQTGAVARPTLKTAFRVAPSDTARSIGVKIATAADVFAAGEIGLTVLYATR
ncbi:hypothetical protein [Ciceribacter sp. L1K22]|uniref:hypothetical protein n=1 Tax=Ciceribacter sp. L1K22 TaxID=2820275 RepID=UPI001ABEBF98|nr:hypothetical protein [Ciceribacter sp. L1K22]MBO3760342.1 hypothetical protein [Ciceribacter sp. L1K22]